jgi:hypothetical protein
MTLPAIRAVVTLCARVKEEQARKRNRADATFAVDLMIGTIAGENC